MPEKGDRLWLVLCTATGVAVDVTLNKYSSTLPGWAVALIWAVPAFLFVVWFWRVERTASWVKTRFLQHPVSYVLMFLILIPFGWQATATMIGKLSKPSAKQPETIVQSPPVQTPQPRPDTGGKPAPSSPARQNAIQITPKKPKKLEVLRTPPPMVTQDGAGNQQTVTHAPITQANSGGCNQQVVGGNNNTNNCAPPSRVIAAGDYNDLAAMLRPGAPQVIDILAPVGNDEAQRLGVQLYTIFKTAEWTMKNRIVMSYMTVGGPLDSGITVFSHGEPVTSTTIINLPDNDPLLLVKAAFSKETLLCTFERRMGTPENEIDIQIGVAPPPN